MASSRRKRTARSSQTLGALLAKRFQSPQSARESARNAYRRRTPFQNALSFLGPLRKGPEPEIEPIEQEIEILPVPLQVSRRPEQESQSVATQELVQPQGRLRDSIEGFLLDQRSEHTRRAYGNDLKRFVGFLLTQSNRDQLQSVDRVTVIRYKDQLLAQGLSHTTIDRHLATLKSFFKWLVDDGILTKSPADSVRFLNPRKLSSTQGFTDDEVKRMLAQPSLHTRVGSLHYAILMVLFYCGLRRSELCDIRCSQIRQERGQWVIRLLGKGNRERFIVLPPAVWRAIQHYLTISRRKLEGDSPLFRAIRIKSPDQGSRQIERPLDPSLIYYIVSRTAKEAGIQGRVSPHSCRATAISNARDRQVPDRAIQEFAGWASADMITRYDKRKTAIDQSASLAISYGANERLLPRDLSVLSPSSPEPSASSESDASGEPASGALPVDGVLPG